MNIFQFVQQMEKDGEAYYRELAQKTNDKGLKTILNNLAEDEVKHFKIFSEMEKNAEPEMISTEVLANAKNVFQSLKEEKAGIDVEGQEMEAYEKARDVELHSESFYREKAGEVDNAHHRALFNRIAEEEKKHAHLLEGIIEYISRPDVWLENAEFNNLEDY